MLCVPAALPGMAHPGGLDKTGCHHNRSTGTYHCHRKVTPPPSPTAQKNRSSLAPDAPEPRNPPFGVPSSATAMRRAPPAPRPSAGATPGYGPHLDRDNDGVGCEPYRGR